MLIQVVCSFGYCSVLIIAMHHKHSEEIDKALKGTSYTKVLMPDGWYIRLHDGHFKTLEEAVKVGEATGWPQRYFDKDSNKWIYVKGNRE